MSWWKRALCWMGAHRVTRMDVGVGLVTRTVRICKHCGGIWEEWRE